MDSDAHRRRVLEEFEAALGKDKTRSHILGFTNLGLLEMTRKKVGEDIMTRLQRTCPVCEGSGRVLSEATIAHRTQREVVRRAQATGDEALLVVCHPSVASILIGPNGSALHKLEQHTRKTIYVKGAETLHVEDVEIYRRQEDREEAFPCGREVVDIQIEGASPTPTTASPHRRLRHRRRAAPARGPAAQGGIAGVRTYAKAKLVAN